MLKQKLQAETADLPNLLERKAIKAKAAYHRAVAKAETECERTRIRNDESIKVLEREELQERNVSERKGARQEQCCAQSLLTRPIVPQTEPGVD